MTQQAVLLQLPNDLYERARQIAEDSHRPLEAVLIDSLALLFGITPEYVNLTPSQLDDYSDEQLWALVFRSLAWPQDERLHTLTDLGKQGRLSPEELDEMAALIDQVDRYVLMRSQALVILKERGHDVERRLRLPYNNPQIWPL